MTKQEAREWAAQAWCQPSTENYAMDHKLCEAFANVLHTRVNEAIKSDRFTRARDEMKHHFIYDPDFRRTYVDNITCLIRDRHSNGSGITSELAARILDTVIGLGLERIPDSGPVEPESCVRDRNQAMASPMPWNTHSFQGVVSYFGFSTDAQVHQLPRKYR
jgi:hypothetical protein